MKNIVIESYIEDPLMRIKGADSVRATWEAFLFEDVISKRYWDDIYKNYPQFQFIGKNEENGDFIFGSCNVPMVLGGAAPKDGGFRWALEEACSIDINCGVKFDCLCMLSLTINPKYQSRGISYLALRHLFSIAESVGIRRVIAPVRPPMKARFQTITMPDFLKIVREDGYSIDPWIRAHQRLGGKMLGVCEHSMVIEGDLEDWKKWGLTIENNARFASHKSCFNAISISEQEQRAQYVEPNVWIEHVF